MKLIQDIWSTQIFAASRLVHTCECGEQPATEELDGKVQAAQVLFPEDKITVSVERKSVYEFETEV